MTRSASRLRSSARHHTPSPVRPGDIIRPDGVGFLDYEVELGLVIGADLPVGTTVTDPRYLHDGDVITAMIASPDGRLDLGTQRNTVIGKTP